jgi:peptide/nickel transport system ATP-binding protein
MDGNTMATQSGAVLRVDNLTTCFGAGPDRSVAVNGLSFSVGRGETLGIVGESGCGKSVTSLSIMRLLAKAGNITGGTISFNGTNLLALSEKEMRRLRGNRISMIFQEPMTSLNPTFTVGRQIAESIMLHQGKSKGEAMLAAIDLLNLVQISDPQRRLNEYPHQLSGGMRQRVMIAMALACQPDVLIADEPTTALDVTIQAQILELLRDIQKRLGTAIVLITHDLGVVAQMCDRVIVMYAGRSVEEGLVDDVLERPRHPYTQALLRSLPAYTIEQGDGTGEAPRLAEIPGIVPVITPKSVGCTFAPRCPEARAICAEQDPPVVEFTHGQSARCWARLDGEKTL